MKELIFARFVLIRILFELYDGKIEKARFGSKWNSHIYYFYYLIREGNLFNKSSAHIISEKINKCARFALNQQLSISIICN